MLTSLHNHSFLISDLDTTDVYCRWGSKNRKGLAEKKAEKREHPVGHTGADGDEGKV